MKAALEADLAIAPFDVGIRAGSVAPGTSISFATDTDVLNRMSSPVGSDPRREMLSRDLIRLASLALATCVCLGVSLAALAAEAQPDPHVASALALVDHLALSNTGYAHGPGSVTWTGTVASHTDCSGFIDHLLMHDDGLTQDDFKRWFGTRRPTADRYHDAIAERRGFESLPMVTDLRPGDLISMKYMTRHDNTGHIMLVIASPEQMRAVPPYVDATTQWSVEVVDSSESGHGTTDTRHKRGNGGRDHDGLGRGVFRLYTDAQGTVTGFAWSTSKASRFVAPQEEHLVMGRFIKGFHP